GLAVFLIPAIASAQRPPVVGGGNAPDGMWPDVAAVLVPTMQGDQPECTGTLIAPSVVITAGPSWNPASPPLPDTVWVGTSSLAKVEGEKIAIARGVAFPDAQHTEDIALLLLARPAAAPPRAIATGWARFDIANGATVELVGFGAINKSATMFV